MWKCEASGSDELSLVFFFGHGDACEICNLNENHIERKSQAKSDYSFMYQPKGH